MTGPEGLQMTRQDGGLPRTVAAGTPPGESGVAVFRVGCQGGLSFSATPTKHLIWFPTSPQVRYECRMAGQAVDHVPRTGTLAITPAGSDSSGDAVGNADLILVAIDPGQLALVAAEASAPGAQLSDFLLGYDHALFDLARTLALESAGEYSSGPLFWDEVASGFLDSLVARHSSPLKDAIRGVLGKDVLGRIREYVMSHLDEAIEVATLAEIAGRSPFYFTRMFTRTVGIAPHRYIVHLRLRRAIELIRSGQYALAQVALCTGFADQSHLTRWMRRVHGVSLTQLGTDNGTRREKQSVSSR
ncbi:AraC family transcriptional regulator [Bradyrhizobium sp. JR7.2]|uniref:helix-turn-helix domain-containing protein n=1 Tax=Bradyrhizobium TaxID=374 RepID=UPI0024AF86B2|nr:AraC family transcriptional regulator [Bradyrhizobium barranii]WFT92260.1 AraC family transcriptional regulator [Bradyrhizobium barranii]